MSTSYNDLRAVAQRHAMSSPATPLLPSPITREPRDEGQSYFKFHNPRGRNSISDNESLDTLKILSYYYEDKQISNDLSLDDHVDYNTDHEEVVEDDDHSTASESMPTTPLDHEYRATFCSDESGWLANTTSHDERMRRFKTRFYQVVQHPWRNAYKQHGRDEVVSLSLVIFNEYRLTVSDDRYSTGRTRKAKAGPDTTSSLERIQIDISH